MFQSTRPRGARPRQWPCSRSFCGFNPRARAGRDPVSYSFFSVLIMFQSTRPRGARHYEKLEPRGVVVSIHAPARGATMLTMLKPTVLLFQSTRPRGARPIFFPNPNSPSVFQSTRPRGARQDRCILCTQSETVSIHAPARGATRV